MKLKLALSIHLLVTFSFYLSPCTAQVPQGLNYQAVAGDAAGNALRNVTLQVKISILSDTLTPVIEWEELHPTVKTNLNGVFSIVIGSGQRQTSSAATAFNALNWNAPQLFLRSQVYYQGAWKTMGSAKLWAVPYSMVAGQLSGTLNKLAVSGSTVSMEEALFEVKNKDGQTIFAVYNEGVRVYVDNGSKGSKGGFSVGGFGDTKLPSQQLLFIDPDSIRAYINTGTGKAAKGGFSIGGFGAVKLPGEEYLRVTRDSTRINVKEPVKGSKGGFSVGGFTNLKGTDYQFLQITPMNYFIGQEAGSAITTGIYNSFMGYQSGKTTTTGGSNIFVGYKTGSENISGDQNIFVGFQSGMRNTTGHYNLFVGTSSGESNTTGYSNLFIGNYSGQVNTTGIGNQFIGHNSGYSNVDGNDNLFIGANSGMFNVSGNANTFLGASSGKNNTSGLGNTFIGEGSGLNNLTGIFNIAMGMSSAFTIKNNSNHNVFLGYLSGRELTDSSSNNVFIGSASAPAMTRGSSNIIIGKFAGQITSGINNVFIGDYTGSLVTADNNVVIGTYAGGKISGGGNVMIGSGAGQYETGSNKLFITNSNGGTDVALIYGEFDNALLKLNGTVKVRDLFKLQPRAAAPANPEMGDVYFDSTTKKLMVYDGTSWQSCW